MITYDKGGKGYLLMANSSRGIMKIGTDNIDNYGGITDRVGGGGTKGVPYDTIKEWQGVEQLAKLDDKHALLVVRNDGSSLDLVSKPLP